MQRSGGVGGDGPPSSDPFCRGWQGTGCRQVLQGGAGVGRTLELHKLSLVCTQGCWPPTLATLLGPFPRSPPFTPGFLEPSFHWQRPRLQAIERGGWLAQGGLSWVSPVKTGCVRRTSAPNCWVSAPWAGRLGSLWSQSSDVDPAWGGTSVREGSS